MVAGTIPEQWDSNKTNISIYISSEDEFYALGGEWAEGIYPSQLGGIKQILTSFSNDESYHFYLRIHPNLSEVKYSYHLDCLKLPSQFKNITIIPGNSKVNTYDLIKISDKVISFGSSVGIEASYLGIPSILAGNCYYKFLNGTYNPTNHNETVELIKTKLEAKPKLGAYKYGAYLLREGIFHKYFNPNFETRQANFAGLKLRYKVNYREKNCNPLKAIWRYSERYRIFGLPYYLPYRLGVNLVPNEGE